MFQHQNMWLPDGEKHFPEWMSKNGEIVDGCGTYQIKKWRACLPHIKQFRAAIDVGAHVGFWTKQMADKFEVIHAFEPVHQMRECLFRNTMGLTNILVYGNALGSTMGRVVMSYDPADSGNTHVERKAGDNERGLEVVKIKPLDWFGVKNVDFIKIDCEGFEEQVVLGAVNTLKQWRPCVIVEQKAHKLAANFGIAGRPACELLVTLGAKQRQEIGGDFIFSWD